MKDNIAQYYVARILKNTEVGEQFRVEQLVERLGEQNVRPHRLAYYMERHPSLKALFNRETVRVYSLCNEGSSYLRELYTRKEANQ